jgi:hypothetical protein
MSKPSRRPSRALIKEQRREKRQQEQALRARQRREGLCPRTPPALPNTCKDLPTIWEVFEALKPLQSDNRLQRTWGERRQRFTWVNAIDYAFTSAGRRQHLTVHVVLCEETWEKLE